MARGDDGTNVKMGWVKLPKKSRHVEVEWMAAAGDGNDDGYIKLWVNDTFKKEQLNIDNDIYALDEVRFGVAVRLKKKFNISGNLKLDAFQSGRSEYIGP